VVLNRIRFFKIGLLILKMFEFLKKKLKGFVERVTKRVEEKKEEVKEVEEEKEEKGIIRKVIRRISVKKLTKEDFDEIFSEIEDALIANNVAIEVVEKLRDELEKKIVDKEIKRGKERDFILQSLREAIESILLEGNLNEVFSKIIENRKNGEVTKFMFVGVNGVGKSTTIAKFAKFLMKHGFTSIFSASDTFRSAAIEQLEKHAKNLGIKVIKHKYGSDPCAVAYDAVAYAKAHGIDCVLIDTAGRQHSNVNLMEELKKIYRVIKPDFVIFVGDALTGNDAVEQAREFDKNVPINFSIVTKADVDIKGGAILSIGYVTKKPIIFLGIGQGYDDIEEFKKDNFLDKILKF